MSLDAHDTTKSHDMCDSLARARIMPAIVFPRVLMARARLPPGSLVYVGDKKTYETNVVIVD